MTTTEEPAAVTAVYTTEKTAAITPDPDMSEKLLTTYRHESNRSVYYSTINKNDIYYPLGKLVTRNWLIFVIQIFKL